MASRKKSFRDRLLDWAIKATACALVLAVVLIGLQVFSNFIASKFNESDKPVADVPVETQKVEPESETEEAHKFTVCIDPGHGGKDIGCDSNGRIEKDDVLKLGLAIQKYLEAQDVKVVMTRDDDTFLKLSARCRVSNEANADYFFSIHRNKGPGNGVETWLYSQADEESKTLADKVMKSINNVGISRDRGIKYGTNEGTNSNYYVNANTNSPAMVLEMGFVNVADDNKLFDSKLDQYAQAIGDAIIATYQQYHADGSMNRTEKDASTAVDSDSTED